MARGHRSRACCLAARLGLIWRCAVCQSGFLACTDARDSYTYASCDCEAICCRCRQPHAEGAQGSLCGEGHHRQIQEHQRGDPSVMRRVWDRLRVAGASCYTCGEPADAWCTLCQLRHGGPGLKGTQAYPAPFGLKLATLACEAGAGAVTPPACAATADEALLVPLTFSQDAWHDGEMLALSGFLGRMHSTCQWSA